MANKKEPVAWITVKGVRVPIFEGQSKEDAFKSFKERIGKRNSNQPTTQAEKKRVLKEYTNARNAAHNAKPDKQEKAGERFEKAKQKYSESKEKAGIKSTSFGKKEDAIREKLINNRARILKASPEERKNIVRENRELQSKLDKNVNKDLDAKQVYKKFDQPHDVEVERRGEKVKMKSYGEGWEEGYHVEHTDYVGGKFIDKGKVGDYEVGESVNYLHNGKMEPGTIVMAHKYPNGKVEYTVKDKDGDGHSMSANNMAKTDSNRFKQTETQKQISKDLDEKERQIVRSRAEADERNGKTKVGETSGQYDKYKTGYKYENAKTVNVNGNEYKVWSDDTYRGTFAEDKNGKVLPIKQSGYLSKEVSQRKAIANTFGESSFRSKAGSTGNKTSGMSKEEAMLNYKAIKISKNMPIAKQEELKRLKAQYLKIWKG